MRRIGSRLLASGWLTLVVAIAVYWLLRDQVLDAYPVPTPSMEPTIEGDEEQGDVVLVDKTFDNRARPKRFDTIVFEHEHATRTVVKRIVGLPREWILIRNYDLWVGPSPHELSLVRKSPADFDDMLVRIYDDRIVRGGFAAPVWRREHCTIDAAGCALSGAVNRMADLFPKERWDDPLDVRNSSRWRAAWNMTWAGVVMTSYLDGFGAVHAGGTWAWDFGVRLKLHAEPAAALWIDLRFGRHSYALRYEARGHASLWKNGEPVQDAAASAAVPRLDSGAVDLTFVYLDGGFRLAVSGRDAIDVRVPFDVLKDAARARVSSRFRRVNGLALAAAGGSVRLEHLEVVRDLHYLSIGPYAANDAYRIPDHEWFVLGDNSPDSRDSRHYGSVDEGNFIGKPIAIAAPWSRRHWIKR